MISSYSSVFGHCKGRRDLQNVGSGVDVNVEVKTELYIYII